MKLHGKRCSYKAVVSDVAVFPWERYWAQKISNSFESSDFRSLLSALADSSHDCSNAFKAISDLIWFDDVDQTTSEKNMFDSLVDQDADGSKATGRGTICSMLAVFPVAWMLGARNMVTRRQETVQMYGLVVFDDLTLQHQDISSSSGSSSNFVSNIIILVSIY